MEEQRQNIVYLQKAVDLSEKPPVTKAYAARWLKKHFDTITAWCVSGKIKVDENNPDLIPVSELFRLDSELNK